jgi:hypothetical protein
MHQSFNVQITIDGIIHHSTHINIRICTIFTKVVILLIWWPLQISLIPMMNNWNWYMGDFLESFVWSSMDHTEDNLKNNYLIFKPTNFLKKKKIIFLLTFLITISHLS